MKKRSQSKVRFSEIQATDEDDDDFYALLFYKHELPARFHFALFYRPRGDFDSMGFECVEQQEARSTRRL